MSIDSYIVHLIGHDGPSSFKVFSTRLGADNFAVSSAQSGQAECAEIWLVQGVSDARAALAALKMGEAKFILQRSRKPSSDEIQQKTDLRWKRAKEAGPNAVQKFLGFN